MKGPTCYLVRWTNEITHNPTPLPLPPPNSPQAQNGGASCWAAGGNKPTIADFVLYDVVEQCRTLAGGILAAGALK